MMITDTRGIEQQFNLMWNGRAYPFNPGAGNSFEGNSGLHASVPVNLAASVIPFSFELDLKGSEGVSIAPLGGETELSVSSSWPTPKFVGSFLPAEREISDAGFSSIWKISSFGRSYPQTWERGEVGMEQLIGSAAGVDLYQQVNAYDMVFRSVKYAVLFIVITFGVFFLFDVLASVRVHPIQYFLVGSALALFYLLLLSLSEQIGFFPAYALATTMVALLVTGYSASVLKSRRRALPIFGMLAALYGYLYFILQLEDYALLFGSLLVFAFLAVVMYMTRNVDWFSLGGR
jgi:inner membrane protein